MERAGRIGELAPIGRERREVFGDTRRVREPPLTSPVGMNAVQVRLPGLVVATEGDVVAARRPVGEVVVARTVRDFLQSAVGIEDVQMPVAVTLAREGDFSPLRRGR